LPHISEFKSGDTEGREPTLAGLLHDVKRGSARLSDLVTADHQNYTSQSEKKKKERIARQYGGILRADYWKGEKNILMGRHTDAKTTIRDKRKEWRQKRS